MKTCILHIGMHKTGSSSIQDYLTDYRTQLGDKVIYADMVAANHSGPLAFALMDLDSIYNRSIHNKRNLDFEQIDGMIKRNKKLLFDALELNYQTIIFSAEGLLELSIKELNEFKKLLLNYVDRIHVIAYVRPIASFMASAFQQRLKIEEVVIDANLRPKYKERFLKFEDVFGNVNYNLFHQEHLVDGNVVADFCHKFDLPYYGYPRSNESLSYLAVKFLYHLQKLKLPTSELLRSIDSCQKSLSILKSKPFKLPDAFCKDIIRNYLDDVVWMEDRLADKGRLLYSVDYALDETDTYLNNFSVEELMQLKVLTNDIQFSENILNWSKKSLSEVISNLPVKKTERKCKALICTGFHRSATSATANYLANSGLNMGSNLVLNHISNAKGHFEDLLAVQLHDEQLLNNGSSWQFHDEVKLAVDNDFLIKYCHARSLESEQWGVKDPRACLFLEEWNETLTDNGFFLLVVRHWSGCIESLLTRHSRELAYALDGVDINSPHFKHWLQPELSASMWLAYNKRMLSFAKKYPKKVLLCTQRSIFEGAPILSTLNQEFGFTLNEVAGHPFESGLFNDEAYESVRDSLSSSMQAELNIVWEELLNIANFKSFNEEPIYKSIPALPNIFHQKYLTQVDKSVKYLEIEQKNLLHLKQLYIFSIPDTANEQEFIDWLITLRSETLLINQLEEIERKIEDTSGQIHLEYANTLQALKHYEKAIHQYHKCLAFGITFPFVYMLLGRCYQTINERKLALFFYEKALNKNPKNPAFYVALANYLLIIENNDAAEKVFCKAINLLGYLTPIITNYCDLLMKRKRDNEALQLLLEADLDNSLIQQKMTQVQMNINHNLGIDSYYQFISKQLKDKNKIEWLANITKGLTGYFEEKDFLIRCYLHWEKLEK